MKSTQDHKSDRKTWMFVLAFVVLSCFVEITTANMEAARGDLSDGLSLEWLYELSSHFAILPAAAIVPLLLKRYPIDVENWTRGWPVYVLGFFGFLTVHVGLMVAIRHVIYPMLAPGPYNFGFFTLEPWIYELRKDMMTYLLILSSFLIGRHVGQLKLEARAARDEARDTGRLTLKCGGRTIYLKADEILYAKAAANYVEIFTGSGHHLARMTLSSLERLLAETSGKHLRIHRSYLVNKDVVRTLTPNGDGDASVMLEEGTNLPVSRKYRSVLEVAEAV